MGLIYCWGRAGNVLVGGANLLLGLVMVLVGGANITVWVGSAIGGWG